MTAEFADDPSGIFLRYDYSENAQKSKGKSSRFSKIYDLLINIYINDLRMSRMAA
jgi:hypothetical protein